jgi:hypothetical protein
MQGIRYIANYGDEHTDDSYGWLDRLYQDGIDYDENVQYKEWEPCDYVFYFPSISSFFSLVLGYLPLDHILESIIYYWYDGKSFIWDNTVWLIFPILYFE